MKKVLSNIHRPARRIFFSGSAAVVLMLFASTLFYIGAGRFFDYFLSIEISEMLLEGVRPLSVAVCAGSLATEYFLKQKNID